MTAAGRGWCPGTCGELVQGMTSGGLAFQVSLPVDIGTTIEVSLGPAAASRTEVAALVPVLPKTGAALRRAATALGRDPVRITVRARRTELPVGAGLGSSTADIVAAARAVASAAGATFTPDELAALAGAIEPSDPVMYDGIVLSPRRGPAIHLFGWSPAFTILALIPPTGPRTTTVDLRPQRQHAAEYDQLLADLRRAAADEDGAAFAAAAVRSAQLHQPVLANRYFPQLPALSAQTGAVGWNVAHTGSAAGLLYLDAELAANAHAWVADQVGPDTAVRLLHSPGASRPATDDGRQASVLSGSTGA